MITYFTSRPLTNLGAFNLGGTNGSGQVPVMPGNFMLIDPDTPADAYTKAPWNAAMGNNMELVFSDEFNVDGRTFYPGDDPYWEAVDLHYWATNNLEWYDPEAITTQDGNLVITLSQKETHNLHYQGGMMSTWNKFCFTGGYIEASVVLPGLNNIVGLWPAIWTMGNLGRAGYGATLEGMVRVNFNVHSISKPNIYNPVIRIIHSGPIPMIHVTLERSRIRQSTICLWLPLSMVTRVITVCYLSFPGNVYQDVHAPTSMTEDS